MATINLGPIFRACESLGALVSALETANKWDSLSPISRAELIMNANVARQALMTEISRVNVEIYELEVR